jgi:NADH dehydrogenase/NADH:ubiquinone oxidoreductase subunit G
VEGRVQFMRPAVAIEPPMRESWEVLVDLGERLGAEMDFAGVFGIQKAIAGDFPALAAIVEAPAAGPRPTPVLYGPARP